MGHWGEKHPETRERLWLVDRKCYWCRRETLLITAIDKLPANPLMATREHLYSRFYYKKRIWNPVKVLACYECNDLRAKFEMEALKILGVTQFDEGLMIKITETFKRWALKQYER